MSKLKNLKRYRQAEPEAWEKRASGQVPGAPVKALPKKKPGMPYQNWLIPGIVVLVLLSLIGFVVKVFLSSSGSSKKPVYQVTMIKHQPPEEKVKPPEPEQQKELPKDAIPTTTDIPQPEAQDQSPDSAPPGADLGVAGEGGAGSDGFGLVGKGKNYKGKDITLGGPGSGGMNRLALLTKYGWYTSTIQEEVKKQMRKRLDQDGGIPKGKLQVMVKLSLDSKGRIIKFELLGTSGNSKLDDALRSTLAQIRISEPPPEGMPSGMTVRIISQG
jgi:outer membrane biosynthesis protein TonB